MTVFVSHILQKVVSDFKKGVRFSYNTENEDVLSDEGKHLQRKSDLERLPGLVFTGDI